MPGSLFTEWRVVRAGRSRWGWGTGGRSIDVSCACKEDVGFNMHEVGAVPPHIFTIINDGHHGVTTGKHRPVCRHVQKVKNVKHA